jgi:4-oxalocrotonate tautomerase
LARTDPVPHVIVKLWPGKTSAQKQALSEAIVRDVTSTLGYGDDSVSVGFEEVSPAEWSAKVYGPDIQDRWATLTKAAGLRTRTGAVKSKGSHHDFERELHPVQRGEHPEARLRHLDDPG